MTKAREKKVDARHIVSCTFEDEKKQNTACYAEQTDGPAGRAWRHEGRSFGEPALYEFVPAEGAEMLG